MFWDEVASNSAKIKPVALVVISSYACLKELVSKGVKSVSRKFS